MRLERHLIAAFMCLVYHSCVQARTWNSHAISDSMPSRLQCPDSSLAFDRLWATMDSIRTYDSGELTILYIGGSHVQGGWIGHEMRRSLAAWAPHAGLSRGMQLPYRIAQTNTPTHFRTQMDGHWKANRCTRASGKEQCEAVPIATGIVAYPSDTVSIQHVSYLPDSTRTACSSIEIWTNANRSQWRWTGNATLNTCSPLNGHLGWQLEFDAPADTLALTFINRQSSDVWYAGMNCRNKSTTAHIAFHEWGHNGLRIRHAAVQSGWTNLLRRIQPDLIFIGIGLNDAVDGEQLNLANFGAHYTMLTDVLIASGAAIVLLGNTPATHRNVSLADPNASIGTWLSQHGKANGMAYLDLMAALGGPRITSDWIDDERMQTDGMHFTAEGYQTIASILFEAWMDAYSNAQKAPLLNHAAEEKQAQ